MKKVACTLFLLMVAIPLIAQAWTLQWQATTKYTDGSAVTHPVTYEVWDNGTKIGTGITATSFLLPNPGSGVTHVYEVAATVDNVTGAKASVNFTSPYLTPAAPGGVQVVP